MTPKYYRRTLFLALVISLAQALSAQESVSEAPRFALLIGNAAYEGNAALKNPVNDVDDMAAALSSIGWKTRTVTNADRRTIGRALTAFREELIANPGTIAMFFYAGHAMQIDGTNYLLPVNTTYDTVDDVKLDAIPVTQVTDAIQAGSAAVSLMILDACRDNPFAKSMTRSLGGTRGLTVVQSAGGLKGSAILFSTSPGDVALDGTDRNGVFTGALLRHIDKGLKLEDLFRLVNADVRKATGDAQKPWINASLSADLFMVSDSIRHQREAEAARTAASLAAQAEAARQAELVRAVEAARLAEQQQTSVKLQQSEAARLAEQQEAAIKLQQAEATRLEDQARLAALTREAEQAKAEAAGLSQLGVDSSKVQTSLEEAKRLLEETRQLQLSGGVQIAEVELYAVKLTKDLQGLRTVRELKAFTFDDNLLLRLDDDQKTKIYTAAKKNSALMYAAMNLLPSLGSFSQGNSAHGLFQLGSIAAFFASSVWINSLPDTSDAGPMGMTFWISGVAMLASYGFGFVAPFMYQGNFNKGVQQGILYEP
jgi:uncharacterized caspase-like protein